MKATSVDGVYSADPKVDPNATRFDHISYEECISRELKVMDQTAFTLCKDNKKPIIVFDMHQPGNITRALLGEQIGSVIG
jgi:uridylate kinase